MKPEFPQNERLIFIKKFYVAILLLILTSTISAENSKVDSLLNELKIAKEDTNKVNLLYRISLEADHLPSVEVAMGYLNESKMLAEKLQFKRGIANAANQFGNFNTSLANYQLAIEQYNLAIKLEKELGNTLGVATAYSNLGLVYWHQSNYNEALTNFSHSLKMMNEIGNMQGIANCNLNMGLIYNDQGNYPVTLKYFFEALKIYQKINSAKGVAHAYNNIGSIYFAMEDYDQALQYFQLALKPYQELGNKFGVAMCYNNLGQIFQTKGNFLDAIKYTDYSLAIRQEIADQSGIADCFINKGDIYFSMKSYEEAYKNYQQALEIFNALGNKERIAQSLNYLAQISIELKQYNNANKYLYDALSLSKQLGTKISIRNSYQLLAKLDSINGDFMAAFVNYKMYITYRDSISNVEAAKKNLEAKMNYEFDKKQTTDSLNFAQEKEIGAIKLQRQKAFTFGGLGGLIVAVILLFFVYTNYNKQRLANQKLKEAQQQLIQIEREKEAENIRLRISRDIHDDIGHSLTKISLLSDMTASDKQINSPEAVETLGRISDYSRNVNASLSEIVWAISPTHDSLDSLIVYMRNHIHRFFENTSITYQINFPDAYENRSINPELKRNIFLVLKESLNNTLKYAKAKNVRVDFKIDGDQFELKIKDDGVGFTPLSFGEGQGVRTGGNGLPNMKHRIEQTGGRFEINSSVGSGCEIKISGSFNS